jgi:hypothetical protein
VNSRIITVTILLLVLPGACTNFNPQVYVPGLETTTPEPVSSLPGSSVEPPPTVPSTDTPTLKVCTNVSDGKLHVRFEPSIRSAVRGYLAEGETVIIGTERRQRDGSLWIELSEPILGWVNARYLCPAN